MTQKIYQFDDFLFESDTRTLTRDTERIPLEHKVATTLLCLIENHGQIVSKRQLMDAVWQTSIVEDSGLRRNISVLRSTLDKAQPNRYIETIPGEGYRFSRQAVLQNHATLQTAPVHGSIVLPTATSVEPQAAHAPDHSMKKFSRVRRNRRSWPVIGGLILSIGSFILYEQLRDHKHYVARQLTTNSIELPVGATAISSDGSKIAYADAGGLHIRPVNTTDGELWPIPKHTIPAIVQWFPDGEHLLLTGFDTKEERTAAWVIANNQSPKKIIADTNNISISNDGTHLAYYLNNDSLYVSEADGSAASLVLKLNGDSTFECPPRFAPDGKSVLFVEVPTSQYARSQNTQMYSRINAIDIQSRVVTSVYDPENEYILDFALTNDNVLLVAQEHHDSAIGSVVLKIRLNPKQRTHSNPELLLDWPNQQYVDKLGASADGNRIIMIGNERQSDIYIADLDSAGLIMNTSLLTFDTANDRPYSWLPDNRTILFYSDRNGSFDLFKQEIDSKQAKLIVGDPQDLTWPVASPNQRWPYYISSQAGKYSWNAPSTLMRKSMVNSAAPESLGTTSDLYRSLHCAALGSNCVIAEQTADERLLYQFDQDSGRQKLIAKYRWNRNTNHDWDVSPDGDRIAFLEEHGKYQITIIDASSGEHLRSVTLSDKATPTSINWDASGSGFYLTTHDPSYNILRLLLVTDSGETRVLYTEANNPGGWAIPSPDGKHLAIHKFTQHANVWMLEATK